MLSATNAKVLTNHSLKIVNASWKNAGIYVCRAFQKILQTRDAELIYVVKVRRMCYQFILKLSTIKSGEVDQEILFYAIFIPL